MLGADVGLPEAERLLEREFERLLGPLGERGVARGCRLPDADRPDDLAAHPLDRDVERAEDVRGDPVPLAEESEQDVLGPDVVVLEPVCLFVS